MEDETVDTLLDLGRIRSSSSLVGVVVVVVVVVGEESLGDNSISSSDFAVTPVEGEDKGVDERDML